MFSLQMDGLFFGLACIGAWGLGLLLAIGAWLSTNLDQAAAERAARREGAPPPPEPRVEMRPAASALAVGALASLVLSLAPDLVRAAPDAWALGIAVGAIAAPVVTTLAIRRRS